jgi:hypothetical protein
MMVVVSVVIGDNIIASKVDGVGTSDLEEDSLILCNCNVKRLLVVLESV